MSLSLPDTPSRNRSASVGESGLPKHEHKRLRLSDAPFQGVSDDRMSPDTMAEPVSNGILDDGGGSATTDERTEASDTSLLHTTPPTSLIEQVTATSPTSKVTINTRPLSSQSLNDQTVPTEVAQLDDQMNFPPPATIQSSLSGQLDGSATSHQDDYPDAISISSSNGDEPPPIEVSAPEDFDQDPSESNWEIVGRADARRRMVAGADYVHRTFPGADDFSRGSAHVALANLTIPFSFATAEDDHILKEVKTWLVNLVDNCTLLDRAVVDGEFEFWTTMPHVAMSLLQREVELSAELEPRDVIDFLVAFARVGGLIAGVDAARFRSYPESVDGSLLRPAMSPSYLQTCRLFFAADNVPLYQLFRKKYATSPGDVVRTLVNELLTTGADQLFGSVAELIACLAPLLPRKAVLTEHITQLMTETAAILRAFGARLPQTQVETLKGSALQILTNADAALERAIVKQHAWLTMEHCEAMLAHFESFITPVVLSIPVLCGDIVASAGVDPAVFGPEELPTLANLAWRSSTLRKCIRHGRMELRVSGINTLRDDLSRLYQEYILPSTHRISHPAVRFMVHFIRDNELVKYIIGVDSHPQIIARSQAIVGFLCVAHAYEQADTDLIWTAFLNSQDARAGAEILSVIQNNLDNFFLADLQYVVQKVLDLGYQHVDIPLLSLILRLLEVTFGKASASPDDLAQCVELTSTTARLCLYLLRESNTGSRCMTELAARIRQQIPDHLRRRLELHLIDNPTRIPPEDLKSMFAECCHDIRVHAPLASGSAAAIFHMLRALDRELVTTLAREMALTEILIEDIAFLSQTAGPDEIHIHEYEFRLCTFYCLVMYIPEDFSPELLEKCWTYLLAAQTRGDIRSLAWSTLASGLEQCSSRNPVLDRLIADYAARVAPSEYDDAILRFAQQAVRYQSRLSPAELLKAEAIVQIPGIERVWTIMLEAPPGSVELHASEFIIQEYLDSDRISDASMSVVQATHFDLVERCVHQVTSAAARLQAEPPQINDVEHSDSVVEPGSRASYEMRFFRSLHFLKRFLESLKVRPRFMQTSQIDLNQHLSSFDVKGTPIELKLQIHNHPACTNQVQHWIVGAENTADELWCFIFGLASGLQFTIIWKGQRAAFKENQSTLHDLKFGPGLIMVSMNRSIDTSSTVSDRTKRATSPVDTRIMHHFDQLYRLLGLDNRLAKAVYEFLTTFSTQDVTTQKLRSQSTSAEELLPVDRPYELMYCARTLRSCIEVESFSATPNVGFLAYAIKVIVTTLSQFHRLKADADLRLTISHGLAEAWILALKAKPAEGAVTAYATGIPGYGAHVLDMWSRTLEVGSSPSNSPPLSALARAPFEVLIESLLHTETLWPTLSETAFLQLLAKALVHHNAVEVRQATLDVIRDLTGNATSKSSAKTNDSRAIRSRFPPPTIVTCLSHLWAAIAALIPEAVANAKSCQELFEAALCIFQQYGKTLQSNEILNYANEWRLHLMEHRYEEEIGKPLVDFVPISLARLLLCCFKFQPSIVQQLPNGHVLGKDIFTTFLFPPLSDNMEIDNEVRAIVLDMPTRRALYDVVLSVSGFDESLATIVAELNSDLVPRDYFFQPNLSNDRQSVRSEVGYAGLRNLANTCYLNSLFSQLFMNVAFREFLLGLTVVDDTQQKVVAELAKVFAYMQNSYEDAVSPDSAVESITQWDGEQIDVTVQMDVDEFFNLLFDRIEFQIPDPVMRNKFKSIYGGQLVQQIKSKECEHVSERLEPFSAVQVEIKGKSSLEDSLRAYVEGEVLQGENKYSCTGCGKHVDAVKRACLKEVPDHLIFNLKRFDYDIMTGMRCKVNDEFSFPEAIDMTPFTLNALSQPAEATQPDIFELVGIIVHSGSAESGHYYSYIRHRPFSDSTTKSWTQFNDSEVTKFDPATIRECCFGGVDYGAVQCSRFYNAYMLFYQRTSSIQGLQHKYPSAQNNAAVHVPLPFDLEKHIAQQNEIYLRSYVAQDPVHATFVKSLLHLLPVNDGKVCSADHVLETRVTRTALDYTDQLSARWKDIPEVEETLKTLELHATRCQSCACDILRWLSKDSHFTDNVVRSCYPVVRKAFSHLTIACWQALSDHHKALQTSHGGIDSDLASDVYQNLLSDFCRIALGGWEYLQRHGRAWDQYFGVLSAIVKLGQDEAQIVIDEELLERTMELIHLLIPAQNNVKRLRNKYHTYLLGRERNQVYGHGSLIQFLADLLPFVALDAPLIDSQTRAQIGDRCGLLYDEAILMGLGYKEPRLHWLNRLIFTSYNISAADEIVATLAKVKILNPALCILLKRGLQETVIFNATSYLNPTLSFLAHAVDDSSVLDVVEMALESIDSTHGRYGSDFLSFVISVYRLENTEMPFEAGVLGSLVYDQMKFWAPVLIMQPNDMHADVRGDTLEFISELLLTPLEAQSADSREEYGRTVSRVIDLIEACANYARKTFLDPQTKEFHMELQTGQANQVLAIMNSAGSIIIDSAADEDRMANATVIMEELRAKSERVFQDTVETSGWREGSSDMEAVSDVEIFSEVSQ